MDGPQGPKIKRLQIKFEFSFLVPRNYGRLPIAVPGPLLPGSPIGPPARGWWPGPITPQQNV